MANERLRDAIHRSQLTSAELATNLGVDPKTVERWITQNRIPYPRHRYAIAAQLGETQSYLWPDALSTNRAAEVAESELVKIYPRRAAIPIEMWRRLLTSATQQISILVYAGLFLPEQHPNLIPILTDRAAAGVSVRILLGDPDSSAVALRGVEEGIADAMAAKIRNVLTWYKKLDGVEGVALALHRTTLYNSIYQFDDEMLVNPHVFGFPAAHAPTLHLRRLPGGDLFDLYADSFNRVWSTAQPLFGPREAP